MRQLYSGIECIVVESGALVARDSWSPHIHIWGSYPWISAYTYPPALLLVDVKINPQIG